MPSSTSGSERAFERRALVALVVSLLALLVPYEVLVRASERRYGVHRARIVDPKTISPRVDGFLADLAAGRRYETFAVGTSRVQFSIRPDVVSPHWGLTENLGMGGVSSTSTLEWIEQLGLRPKLVIVSVTPMDLTPMAVLRGQRAVLRADSSRRPAATRAADGPADIVRAATYSLLHGATEERHRNLGEWLELWRDGGSVLAFLNNEDATGPVDTAPTTDGYTASSAIASPEEMQKPHFGNVANEMIANEAQTSARLIAAIRRFRARGTRVVVVRIPTAIGFRRTEDERAGFDARIRRISRESGAPFIDGVEMMGGEAWCMDPRNFKDAEHMNSDGATAFSRALVRTIEQM